MMLVQYVIVGVIVAAAVGVAVRAVYRTLRGRDTQLNPCASCKLREQCSHVGQHTEQHCHGNNEGQSLHRACFLGCFIALQFFPSIVQSRPDLPRGHGLTVQHFQPVLDHRSAGFALLQE